MCFSVLFFFFFKQKTAYEMRISDWSSDVCSSDLLNQQRQLTIGADLAQGVVSGVAMQDINNLPLMKNMPLGVHEMSVGQQKWQAEMIRNCIIAVISGTFIVFAVLVMLSRRFLPPFVYMRSRLLAPHGGFLALLVLCQSEERSVGQEWVLSRKH